MGTSSNGSKHVHKVCHIQAEWQG